MRGSWVFGVVLLACSGAEPDRPSAPRSLPVVHIEGESGFTDSSGNGHHAVCDTCPESVEGKIGSAFWFDGGNFLRIPHHAELDMTQGFTIAAWFYPVEMTGGHAVFSRSLGAERDDSYIVMQTSYCGNESQRMYYHNGDNEPLCSTSSYDTNNWNHVAATWDGRRKFFFLNGQVTGSVDTKIDFDKHDIIIGADENDEGARIDATFVGAIDDIRVYEYAMDHGQIAALPGLREPPAVRVTDGLSLLYRFDKDTGDRIPDVSGVEPAIDLTIEDPTAARWSPGGLQIDGTRLTSGAADRITESARSSNAFTVEAWMRPFGDKQNGAVFQLGTVDNRNFGLLHGSCGATEPTSFFTLAVRIDTVADGCPGLDTITDDARSAITHLAATRAEDGTVRIFVDEFPSGREVLGGDLSRWSPGLGLTAADGWRGELSLLATYDRALSPAEVDQNFQAGL